MNVEVSSVMRSGLGLSCLMLILCLGCEPTASPPPATEVPTTPDEAPLLTSGPFPVVQVDQDVYHFGKLPAGADARHTFVVKNVGEAPLQLELVGTTCKCTIGKMERDEIPPGESAEVELSWTVEEKAELFRQTALLNTNDPEHPELRLVIEGEVLFPLVLSPNKFWRLPDVEGSEPVSLTGTLQSPLLDAFVLLSVTPSDEYLTVTTTPLGADELSDGMLCGYQVSATLSPEFAGKNYSGSLQFQTDVPKNKDFSVPIEAKRAENILVFGKAWNARGNFLDLGTFDRQQGKKATVMMFIRNPPEDFQFTEVDSDPESLQVALELDPDYEATGNRRRYRLTFEVVPGAPQAVRDEQNFGFVRVQTNHPEIPKIKFGVSFRALE